jgi:uncharacterized cupredoxin-like copper-binding protein
MRRFALVALVSVFTLIAAACGGDDGGSAGDGGGGAAISPTAGGSGTAVAVAVGETDATTMFMRVSQSSVPGGSVTFTITNEGQKEHEFEVFKTETSAADFAVGGDDKAVDPADAEELAEEEGIEPGETRTLTLDLEPGHYALICNEPEHYGQGMFADLSVT